ncbi:hypothetical protein TrST_g9782 [Triparma strigata]|uniref:Methyltransferase type 12 domain-containing protein n=1 Tax=Triparma strigata TaxID=1606541 RepID=A0A9W7EUY3_9STRA|nr:hypothetical protein TrST_g9782 [Triparma strigata]
MSEETGSDLWTSARKMSGLGDERVATLEKLIGFNPQHARAKSLLAIILANRDAVANRSRALELARDAIALRPDDATLRIALARLMGDGDSALEEKRTALESALEIDPTNLEALVLYLTSSKNCDESTYENIQNTISDQDVNRHYELGVYFRRRNKERCKYHYGVVVRVMEKVIADTGRDPKGLHSKAKFWLATVEKGGEGAVERCPKEYVVGLYKGFAPTFDHTLVEKLHYKTPQLLRETLVSADGARPEDGAEGGGEREYSSILDLGCGTGLSGLRFKGLLGKEGSFLGVDLSPEMLVKANERGCYDECFCHDIETCFNIEGVRSRAPFDLVIACDVFVYLGNLERIFEGVKGSLGVNGVFAFSVELLEDDKGGKYNYICQTFARFSHKEEYIVQLAAEYGFEVVEMRKCVLRKNAGIDVVGLLTILR